MSILEKTIENIMSIKTDIQLKALAIIMFAIIAIMMCMPIASGKAVEFTVQQVTVIFLCVSGVIVVILSDRIVSLKFSKDKLNIKLAEIKESMNETIKEVQENISAQPIGPIVSTTPSGTETSKDTQAISEYSIEAQDKLKKAKKLVEEPVASHRTDDLIKDAENIGVAMGMLKEVITSYKRTQNKTEGKQEKSGEA